MIDFTTRSYNKELLDDPSVSFKDISQTMHELNIVNTLLGGHKLTIKAFKNIVGTAREISVCEIGCGGGDNLYMINKYCFKNNIRVKLIGIDINDNCIQFAKTKYNGPQYQFMTGDYRNLNFDHKPDIIYNSLFCHHFINEDVVHMCQWMQHHCNTGFFINDLHRHSVAYYSIKMLTRFFSNSYLVKYDAPLSVLRGFTKKEWINILHTAGLHDYTISWQWAFRHMIICKK